MKPYICNNNTSKLHVAAAGAGKTRRGMRIGFKIARFF